MDKDTIEKSYFSDNDRFADLMNGLYFGGKTIIRSGDLQETDTQTGIWKIRSLISSGARRGSVKIRDLIRKTTMGTNFVVLGIENQEEADYTIALRTMAYDLGEYEKQLAVIRKRIRKNYGDITVGEFLYGFTKESRLYPVMTTILFYGEEWDGPRCLWDMIDFKDIPNELKDRIPNYPVNLIEIRKLQCTQIFKSDIKLVFDFIRCSKDKTALKKLISEDEEYQNLQEDTYDMLALHSRETGLSLHKEKYITERGVNMCQAIDDLIADGRQEGRQEGREETIGALIETCHEFGMSREVIIDRIFNKCHLERDKAAKLYDKVIGR